MNKITSELKNIINRNIYDRIMVLFNYYPKKYPVIVVFNDTTLNEIKNIVIPESYWIVDNTDYYIKTSLTKKEINDIALYGIVKEIKYNSGSFKL